MQLFRDNAFLPGGQRWKQLPGCGRIECEPLSRWRNRHSILSVSVLYANFEGSLAASHDTHAPLSKLLRLLAPMASDLRIGDVLNNNKGSHLDLFTVMLFFLADKDRNIHIRDEFRQ